jgi:hypothetical protein
LGNIQTAVVIALSAVAVLCWGVAAISGIACCRPFRRYLSGRGEWGRRRGVAPTREQIRESLEMWRRFLGRTPDGDAEEEAARQLARRRFLRALQGGGGFVLCLGLAAIVSVL